MVKLTVRRRKNLGGVSCVAPFIGIWNVWDIPEQEWTEAVQKAVINAYGLGVRHAADEMQEYLRTISNRIPDIYQPWENDDGH